jgi:parvulin-like peptidyl-prolyl isomerase
MKFKPFRFVPLATILVLLIAGLIALAMTSFPFWGAFLVVIAALIVNVIITQIEDDARRGFDNPNIPDSKLPNDSNRDD